MRQPLLIGIGGKLGSGKDTVADYLGEHHGFVKLGMSDPLQDALMTLNQWIRVEDTGGALSVATPFYELIEAGIPRVDVAVPVGNQMVFFAKYADITNALGYTEAKKIVEYREALQLLGTDVARKQWSENHWVDIAERRVQENRANGDPVIITGIRFTNEAEMITRNGGVLVWVNRPGLPDIKPELAAHASENTLSQDDFNYELRNTGTIGDLYGWTEIFIEWARLTRPRLLPNES